MRSPIAPLAVCALLAAGCGGGAAGSGASKLDVSSPEAMTASYKSIRDSLEGERRSEFESDFALLTAPKAPPRKEGGGAMPAALIDMDAAKALDGLTVDEVHTKAEAARAAKTGKRK